MATNNKQVNTTKTTKTNKTYIDPIKCKDFDPKNINISTVITTDTSKFVNTTYNINDVKQEFVCIASKCNIITFKEVLPFGSTPDNIIPVKEDKKKYQLYLGLTDDEFRVSFLQAYESHLIKLGVENSREWFNNEMDENECKDMFKSVLTYNEKYGWSIGAQLSKDFSCASKTDDLKDVSNLSVALAKKSIVNVCFRFKTIKLGVGKYSIGFEINKINIMSVGKTDEYVSNSIKPENYVKGKLTISKVLQHPKGGKYIEVLNDSKKLNICLTDIVGRIFKFEKDNTVSYSLSVRLTDATIRKMFENIDTEVFSLLLANSKDIYGKLYTNKLLQTIVKRIIAFNKADQDRIKKGEKPQNDPSCYFKIPFYTVEKGFEGRVVNSVDNKPITNIDSLLNKDLNITSLEAYCKHFWIGPKGTSPSFPINKCKISFDNPEYNMDEVDTVDNTSTTSSVDDTEREDELGEGEDEEVENSDDE
jgi:hypothetical protein